MRVTGLEPARSHDHQPLKLACLPFHHTRICVGYFLSATPPTGIIALFRNQDAIFFRIPKRRCYLRQWWKIRGSNPSEILLARQAPTPSRPIPQIEKSNSVQSLTLVGVAADLTSASFSLIIFCVAGILVYFSPTGIPCSDYSV